MKPAHVYERSLNLDLGVQDSLSLIYHAITPNSLVLDVGTGSGALGLGLKAHKLCTIHGLSHNPHEVEALRDRYDQVMQLDLEEENLAERFAQSTYDWIVCADVLEHLRNAQSVLSALLKLLKPQGQLILSVPNISHANIVLGLMAGRFVRTNEGLLDATHVHFFERSSLTQLCQSSGARIVHCDAVRKSTVETEFSQFDISAFPRTITDYVAQRPDSDIYQFVWILQAAPNKPDTEPLKHQPSAETLLPQKPQIDLNPQFEITLYADHGSSFNENHRVIGYGNYQEGIQSVELPVPDASALLHGLRLDWPLWASLWEWQGLSCLDSHGHVLFSWNGSWSSLVSFVGCTMLAQPGPNQCPTLMVHGTHPYIHIHFQEPIASVHRVRIRVSAPIRLHVQQTQLLKNSQDHTRAFSHVLETLQTATNVAEEHFKWHSENLLQIQEDNRQHSAELMHRLNEQDQHSAELMLQLNEQIQLNNRLHDRYILLPNVVKLLFRLIVRLYKRCFNPSKA